ncbi:Protease 4 [Buchnera aphidicola (Thelaxes suberi)]|uniref:signal peptide peptidase SppA n=1 Tax=Buchnera aphidicola TaxID=9 RepID=UPI003463AF9F
MSDLWKKLCNIFKWILKFLNIIRISLLNIIFIILIVIMIYSIYTKININYQVNQTQPSALKIDIEGYISDHFIRYPSSRLVDKLFHENASSLYEDNSVYNIVAKIRQAIRDPLIPGIILELKNFTGGDYTALEYIGKSLLEFKKSGKKIYSIEENANQSQYFLDSFANKIFLDPYGSINLHGFSIEETYFKKLLNILQIESTIFRIGKYKSAVEPYIRNNMSKENKKTRYQWIADLWCDYVKTIAKNRNISCNKVVPKAKKTIHDMKKFHGNMAIFFKKNHIIDKIFSSKRIEKELIKIFGLNKSKNSYNCISIYDYPLKKQSPSNIKNNKIAIISIDGVITGNGSNSYDNAPTSIITELENAKNNNDVKAVIIRVNTPGGEVTASEIIRKEIEKIKKAGKPIIISMGDVAASGGYWIATAGDYIIANNNTVTGSIGIFNLLNNFEDSLKLLGISTEQINSTDMPHIVYTKKVSPLIKQFIQAHVTEGYKKFIKLVSKSRNKPKNYIKQIAKGRIWTGRQAKKIGLVDMIGDFDDAIAKAASMSKLTNFELIWEKSTVDVWDYVKEQFNINLFDNNSIQNNTASVSLWLPDALLHILNELIKILKNLTMIHSKQNTNIFNLYAICLNYQKVQLD